MRQQAERTGSLDDGEDLQPALGREQVGGHRVPGLVGGDQPLLVFGVADRLAEADLGHHPGMFQVAP